MKLLETPHAFLFNRQHYESSEGKPIREQYESTRNRMSNSQNRELNRILSGPPDGKHPSERTLGQMANDTSINHLVREALRFHASTTSQDTMPSLQKPLAHDEKVEDAGLYEPDAIA